MLANSSAREDQFFTVLTWLPVATHAQSDDKPDRPEKQSEKCAGTTGVLAAADRGPDDSEDQSPQNQEFHFLPFWRYLTLLFLPTLCLQFFPLFLTQGGTDETNGRK